VVQIHSPLLFTNHSSQSYGFSLTLSKAIISFLNLFEQLEYFAVGTYHRRTSGGVAGAILLMLM
jgi:hypothetical protein